MPHRPVTIQEYTRKSRKGKIHAVKKHTKNQYVTKLTENAFKQIKYKQSRQLLRDRYRETHPDALQIAEITFKEPNKIWAENIDKYDVIGHDAKKPPKVDSDPMTTDSGKPFFPNQIVEYKGLNYICNENGEYKPENLALRVAQLKRENKECD